MDRPALWDKLYRIEKDLEKIDRAEMSKEEDEWLTRVIDDLQTLREFVDMQTGD